MLRRARNPFAVAALLAALAAFATGWSISQEKKPEGASPAAAQQKRSAEEAILKALNEPTEISFSETPLKTAMTFLSEKHNVQIVIDRRKLEDAGINPDDTLLTRSLKGVRLESALNLMLDQLGLSWTIRHEVLTITSRDAVETELITGVYSVADLITPSPLAKEEVDYGPLIAVLDNIGRASLFKSEGAISPWRGTLVISRDFQSHREMHRLLDALRRARRQADEAKGDDRFALLDVGATPVERKILSTLRRKTSVSFIETPLGEVAAMLTKRFGFAFQLDRRGLEDGGINPDDTLVTLEAVDISLHSALDLMRERVGTGWSVRNEVVLLTDLSHADAALRTRIYPVRDLVDTDGDAQSLADKLSAQVHEGTWELSGGPGVIVPFGDLLVCSQSIKVHEELERVLSEIRKAGKLSGDPERPKKSDKLIVRAYLFAPDHDGKVNAKLVEEAAKLLKETVAKESWEKTPGAFVRALPDRLVVRQQVAVHKEVVRFLEEIQVLDLTKDHERPPPRSEKPSGGFFRLPRR
jgi:hypothetical protein